MRLRSGLVVCIQGETCFQSYGPGKYRPLGSLHNVFLCLERHHIDEILLVSPASNPVNGHFTALALDQITNWYVSVPTLQMGHLANNESFAAHCEIGYFERFVFASPLFERDLTWIDKYRDKFGSQSIVGCIPFMANESGGFVYWSDGRTRPLTQEDVDYAFHYCDEVIFQDMDNYGSLGCFNLEILSDFTIYVENTILSGGIGEKTRAYAKSHGYAAVYFDNAIMHQEGGL